MMNCSFLLSTVVRPLRRRRFVHGQTTGEDDCQVLYRENASLVYGE